MSDTSAVDWHPRLPIKRAFWIVLAVSLATLTGSLLASGDVLMLCAFGGWLLAVLTVVIAGACFASWAHGGSMMRSVVAVTVLLLLGQTSIIFRTGRLFGYVLDGRSVAMALLQGLGCAVRQ